MLGKSWSQKKKTSSTIVESEIVCEIDSALENNDTVCAHKLCGAGNGGFFLTFSEKNSLTVPYETVKINVETDGVYGKSI